MDNFLAILFGVFCTILSGFAYFFGAIIGVRLAIYFLEKVGMASKGTGIRYTEWLSKRSKKEE